MSRQKVPLHVTVKQEWFPDAPAKPGLYWFYGAPTMGSMGGHYNGTVKPDKRLMLVDVRKAGKGLVGVSQGNFFYLNKWDGKKEGWLGKWAQASIPAVPEDEEEDAKK